MGYLFSAPTIWLYPRAYSLTFPSLLPFNGTKYNITKSWFDKKNTPMIFRNLIYKKQKMGPSNEKN